MINPDFFLKKYGIDAIIKDCSMDEGFIRMLEVFGVRESYDGDEPYIFISYSHKNSALVLPAIKAIQDKGYPVWYDAGINPGTEWLKVIAEKIDHAALVIAFVSQESIESRFCKSEISRAYNKEKPLLEVRLDRCELPGEMEMQLDGSQRFKAYAYDDGDKYIELLVNTPIIATYIKPVLKDISEMQYPADSGITLYEAEQRAIALEEERRKLQLAEQQKALEDECRKQELAELQKLQQEGRRLEEELRKQELAIERLENIRKMEQCYGDIRSLLKKKSYSNAIFKYNHYLRDYVKPGLELEEELKGYKRNLCRAIYQDACELEKSKKMRDRFLAEKLFGALPNGYRDADLRRCNLEKQRVIVEKKCTWLFPIVYLLLNFVALFALQWIELWYWKILVLTAPMVAYCSVDVYIQVVYMNHDIGRHFPIKLCVAALLVVNPFLLNGMDIFLRILISMGVTALNYQIMYILCHSITWGYSRKYFYTQIKD